MFDQIIFEFQLYLVNIWKNIWDNWQSNQLLVALGIL